MAVDYLGTLNPRQKEAVLHTAGPLLIVAGAGAGKTKTLTHRILHLIHQGVPPSQILAITFTNKAAREMRERLEKLLDEDTSLNRPVSMFERPFVSTFHSLGVHLIKENSRLLNLPRHFSIFDRADSKEAMREAVKECGYDPKQYEPGRLLSAISKLKGDGVAAPDGEVADSRDFFQKILYRVWERYEAILRREKALDFDDLLARSVFLLREHPEVLAHYQNTWGYLLIDEYQDTNRVQYDLARLLAAKSSNICAVGDVDQCLPAKTEITLADGNTKPIEQIRVGDHILSNYGSGDMRAAKVVDTFSKKISGEVVRMRTAGGRTITSTPEHLHFAGYRRGVTPQMFFTYLMHKRGYGYRLGVSQTYTAGQRKTLGFIQRANQEHADALWVVATHSSPAEARLLEYTLSLQYQIPTLPFVARRGGSRNGLVHNQATIDRVFKTLGNSAGAEALLQTYGLSPAYPHHQPQGRDSNRRRLLITLCADHRGRSPMHRISMIGNDPQGKKKLLSLGLSVRAAKRSSNSWRFETVRASYAELMRITKAIQQKFENLEVVRAARFGGPKQRSRVGNSLPFLPAASVRRGMVVFDERGAFDRVVEVETVHTHERVYDLNVVPTHNFIAGGICTHNSIYSWRGADFKNLMRFEKDYPDATVILLEQNYRSTKNILQAANAVIEKNTLRQDKRLFTDNPAGEKISLYGAFSEEDEAAFVAESAAQLIDAGTDPSAIACLYRANFQSRVLEEACLTRGVPYQVLGVRFFERKEVKDVLSYLRAALNPDGLADFKRALATPARGVGKVGLLKVLSGQDQSLPPGSREKVLQFKRLLTRIGEKASSSPPSQTMLFIIEESGLKALYEKGGEEDEERLGNLSELVSVASKYDALPPLAGVEQLLSDAALESDQDRLDRKKDGVKLMTVHAAKGLEFDYVFVTGLEEGLFPMSREEDGVEEQEEERRLFYVALTRARRKLFLSYASVRTVFGSQQINIPSQFLNDISEELLEPVAGETPERGPRREKIIYLE